MGVESEAKFSPLGRGIVEGLYPKRMRGGMDAIGFCDAVLGGRLRCSHAAMNVLIAWRMSSDRVRCFSVARRSRALSSSVVRRTATT